MTQYRVRITPLLMLLFWQMAVGCALASTPYDRIVGRNLFGIKPAVPAPPTDSIKIPIIELQGIHVILEKKQVLFKFANSSKFGYILAEGESQDGIKIVGIDVKGGIVKIINYGVPQTLDMVKNSAAFAGFSEVKVFVKLRSVGP